MDSINMLSTFTRNMPLGNTLGDKTMYTIKYYFNIGDNEHEYKVYKGSEHITTFDTREEADNFIKALDK